jgi:hypothetical protein
MKPRRRTRSRAVFVTIAFAACVTAHRTSVSSMAASYGPGVSSGIDQLRAATRRYQSLDSAVAAGYPRDVPACLVHEHHGAMGYHHSNPALADAKLDVEHPEILLYERMPNGEYRLNGVEFIVPYRAWPRDSVPPMVMGQQLKHEDNLKIWYLHTWAWRVNPNGLFADFHPDVQCSASARRVFTPYAAPPR